MLGDSWLDAAYVAERVLTADELKEYVDKNWKGLSPAKESAATKPDDSEGEDPEVLRHLQLDNRTLNIRHLLARRLTRLQRFKDAKEYYPREYQGCFSEYARSMHDGRDPALPAKKRAAALWQAAQIARWSGLDLMGSELEPDWDVLGGDFQMDDISAARMHPKAGPLTKVGKDETARVQASRIEPNRRFHYRYVAADIAWQAAELMPDNSKDAAEVLATAGSWLKLRDPQAANRFYRALVTRCGKTKLGQAATKLHWFPDDGENGYQ